jgi:hypothetical protein
MAQSEFETPGIEQTSFVTVSQTHGDGLGWVVGCGWGAGCCGAG